MKITISFQNIDHTPALDTRINEKSAKLHKWLEGKSHLKWNCYVKDNHHYAELGMVAPRCEFHATAKSDSLYKCIDLVINKLEKQISKKNDKVKNKLHRKGNGKPVILDVEQAWTDYDEDYFKDAA